MESNNLYNSSQHGFRSGRSTVTQLLQFLDEIFFKLELGCQHVDIIYLDFTKAFNKVDHDILLYKMKQLRIEGKILNWTEAFLKRRVQQVKVEQALSSPTKVISGVPQGSVLGPLLFLIMLTDINDGISGAKVTSFADDTRLVKGIRNNSDQNEFQTELNKVYAWANENNMVFNDRKFEHLSFGTADREVSYSSSSNTTIENKDSVKDLGIRVPNDLLFKLQIEELVAKGHRMSGFVLRTFTSRTKDFMRTMQKSLITPVTEHGCVIWSPGDQTQVAALESVQRRFTSKIACYRRYDPNLDIYICVYSYAERLKDLKLYSQQRRLERFLIIQMHKIIIGYLPNCGLSWGPPTRDGWYVTPKTILDTSVPNWIRRAKDNSFFVRAPSLYNSLHKDLKKPEVIILPTKNHVLAFKARLDHYLEGIPDDPDRGSDNSLLSPQIRYRDRR